MKTIYKIIYATFIGILFFSCDFERYVDSNEIRESKHLVINSMVSADTDTLLFQVCESLPMFRPAEDFINDQGLARISSIEGATIELLVNDHIHPVYFDKDKGYYSLCKLKAQDKLKISAELNGRKSHASTVIPAAPQIVSVDTTTVTRIYSGSPIKFLKYEVRIKDISPEKDYYRLKVHSNYSYSLLPPKPELRYWSLTSNNIFITDDPVLTDGIAQSLEDEWVGLFDSPRNYLSIFKDNLFNDDEYTLVFYVFYPYINSSIENWQVKLELLSISEDMYKYYSSLQRFMWLMDNQMSEPAIIYNNIENGLGILGSANQVSVFHIIKTNNE